MSRCFYCRKESTDITVLAFKANAEKTKTSFAYCSPECRTKIEDFVEFSNKNLDRFVGTGFLILLSLIVALILAKIFFSVVVFRWFFALGLLAMGVWFFRYPLGTWRAYQRLGIKYTVGMIRVVAVLLIVISIYDMYLLLV